MESRKALAHQAINAAFEGEITFDEARKIIDVSLPAGSFSKKERKELTSLLDDIRALPEYSDNAR